MTNVSYINRKGFDMDKPDLKGYIDQVAQLAEKDASSIEKDTLIERLREEIKTLQKELITLMRENNNKA